MPSTTEKNDLVYVPIEKWPTLEDLSVGFGEHLMPASSGLAGETVTIIFAGVMSITHHFATESSLNWEINSEPMKGVKGKHEYKAFEVRPGIFLVDFYKPEYEEQVTFAWKRSTGQIIAGISKFTEVEGQRRTKTDFFQAHVATSPNAAHIPETEELVGRHIVYRYTPRDAYEHVYLNRGTLTWHCLFGTEKGLADTEYCRVFKVSDQLYLLFWTETVAPVESIVIVDLQKMRTTGRFFCWDPKLKQLVRMNFGSYATQLAKTDAVAAALSPALLPQKNGSSENKA